MTGSDLWTHTPLIYSRPLSKSLDCNVYLKLESLQPSGCFKYRGISRVMQVAKAKRPNVHFIIASTGNAGLAVACVARKMGSPCTIFLAEGLDPQFLDSLKEEGANLEIGGKYYADAKAKAYEAAAQNENYVDISTYNDPNLREGNSSIMDEIFHDLEVKPDAIVCSVGGGSLLSGIVIGCQRYDWDDVPIVCLETVGADCFYHSIQANRSPEFAKVKAPPLRDGISTYHDKQYRVNLVRLPEITSVVSSLGLSTPDAGAVRMALNRMGGVRCALVPDALAMRTALSFADDHKMLVELAATVALTPAYNKAIFDEVIPKPERPKQRTIVFIVCGTNKVSLRDMAKFHEVVEKHVGPWEVWIEGKAINVE